jgi:hypothetical protein
MRRPIPLPLQGIGEEPSASTTEVLPDSTRVAIAGLPLHNFKPRNWENLDQIAYAATPAVGADATIIRFQVPLGRNGVIELVACNFVGAGFVEGSGDLLWRILVDGGTPPGANSYEAIPASIGSPANPVRIAGFRIYENQVLTLIVSNVALLVGGTKCGGRLAGYLYPRELEEEDIWI